MNFEPFLRPRLVGARFDEHAIPLEILKDLAVLEEMIIEVAKWNYLQDNPKRQRVPRGFTGGIELRLTGVEQGSAIPLISLSLAGASALFPPDNQHYFEKARDNIVFAIKAVEYNESVTKHLPEQSLAYFDKIGRSLRDGEAIEFTLRDGEISAQLTKETRTKLLNYSKVKEITDDVSIRGAIPEVDQDVMTFMIQMIDGRKVTAPISTQHKEIILKAFNQYEAGQRVLLQGVGKFSRQERLLGFESVEHISLLDPLDVPARLEELRNLIDGWLEGRGVAPRQEGLDWLAQTFEQNFPDDLPLPYVYPTAEGGVQMEWTIDTSEASLEIDLVEHRGEWHFLDMKTDAESTHALNFDEKQDLEWLLNELRNLTGGAA